MTARDISFDENTPENEALFDISNRKRLGINENDIIESLMQCMKELAVTEKEDEVR